MITVTSFGLKHRNKPDGAYGVDCRSLRNPHSVFRLKNLTGLDEPVKRFLEGDRNLEWTLSELHAAALVGATHIAFYCVGGRHRSVYVAEQAAEKLRRGGHDVTVVHLELV